MNVFRGRDSPFRVAEAATFVGSARTRRLASDQATVPVHLYQVQFDAGARTSWHVHSGPQWLFISEGRIRVQRFGEPAQDLEAGDAVVFAAGEKHWHGASPGGRGVHLAVNVNATTQWLEPVSDADYGAATSALKPPLYSSPPPACTTRHTPCDAILTEVEMTDDPPKGPQSDLEQEEFERNAVDPVPWVGQPPEGVVPGSSDAVAGEADARTNRSRSGTLDSEVTAPGGERKPER